MEYPKFKVGCRCITYNHAPYITETMNGFCIQKTDFPFVCMIIDDASNDGEQSIIRKFLKEHFDFTPYSVSYEKETEYADIIYARHKANTNCYFVVLFLKENHYSQGKSYKKYQYILEWSSLCKYIALCEGDDYWIDASKIQKQADYLDEFADCGMCYTKALKYFQKAEKLGSKPYGGNGEEYVNFLETNCVPTLTAIIRNNVLNEFYERICPETKKWRMGDLPLWLFISHEYKVKFLDEVTGVYRVNESSASQSTNLQVYLDFMESAYQIRMFFIDYFGEQVDMDRIMRSHYISIAYYSFLKFKNRQLAINYMKKIKYKTLLDRLKIVIFYVPILAKIYKKIILR